VTGAEQVVVFGAGGAVGRAIVGVLHGNPNLNAIAGLRRAPESPMEMEVRVADATDPESLVKALRGCTLLVNAMGGPTDALAANTAALCAAARRTDVRRLVHISSMAVYGGHAVGLVTESTSQGTKPTRYEAAKIKSEAAIRDHMGAGQEAVILRPGLVFGPGSTQWAHRFARLLKQHRLGDLGANGDGFCNLTHEADLGAGVAAALLTPEAGGAAINLATATPPTWNEFFVLFARALGAVPVRRLTQRRLALEARLVAPALEVARRVASRAAIGTGRLPDAISPSLTRLFAQRIRLDPTLADRLLAMPRTPDEDAIRTVGTRLRQA
jgi:nucleoside-diphosphate-sugar epimerase